MKIVKYLGGTILAGTVGLFLLGATAGPPSQAPLTAAAKEHCERVTSEFYGRRSYLVANVEPMNRSIAIMEGKADLHTKYQAYRELYSTASQNITDAMAIVTVLKNNRECFSGFFSIRDLEDRVADMELKFVEVNKFARARGIIQ